MSDRNQQSQATDEAESGKTSRGINLVLIYSLIFVAFLVAMGAAALIVLPFYRHR